MLSDRCLRTIDELLNSVTPPLREVVDSLATGRGCPESKGGTYSTCSGPRFENRSQNPMPTQVRTVVDHLDGSSEAGEWFPEDSPEALASMQALVRKQTEPGFAIRWEKREAESAGTE